MKTRRLSSLILVTCAALAGCGVGELDNYAPLTVFDNFRSIEEGRAYRSAQLDATTLNLVFDEHGIRTIVNLRGENEQDAWYRNERAAAEKAGVTLVDIRMSAGQLPSRDALLLLYDTFQTAEYPILIHCQSGADRTGAASAIWRMVVRGDTREAARVELSLVYGHFEARHPEMDQLVEMFQPDRDWIAHVYQP
ncbi:MAG: dual specificity protein phosphatase family protein [Phycisphaerae bacterium]|nr:dual specificity protein phosphatase family protein [Phycisphaerae bacterium]